MFTFNLFQLMIILFQLTMFIMLVLPLEKQLLLLLLLLFTNKQTHK